MRVMRHQWDALVDYLPSGTIGLINTLLQEHKVKLILTNPRKHIFGYYKPPKVEGMPHTITINKDLNPYKFLFVLLHEIAHMHTYIVHKHHVKPHGEEWQNEFSSLLKQSLLQENFPPSIELILSQRISKPTSLRSCTDVELMRVLKQFDVAVGSSKTLVENLSVGAEFVDGRGRIMRMLEKKRTRYLCKELTTGGVYSFPALQEVLPHRSNAQ